MPITAHPPLTWGLPYRTGVLYDGPPAGAYTAGVDNRRAGVDSRKGRVDNPARAVDGDGRSVDSSGSSVDGPDTPSHNMLRSEDITNHNI